MVDSHYNDVRPRVFVRDVNLTNYFNITASKWIANLVEIIVYCKENSGVHT